MKKFMVLAACAATFYACSSNDVNSPEINENTTGLLSVSTSVLTQNSKGTKAPVMGNGLPANSEIGVFVFNAGTTEKYNGVIVSGNSAEHRNLLWTVNGNNATSNVKYPLGVKHADVYAYFPYVAANTDHATIPVSAGYTDYLYGKHAAGTINTNSYVNAANIKAHIKLDHALSQIRFTFVKGNNYPDEKCELQSIKILGVNKTGTLNITGDGSIANAVVAAPADFTVLKFNETDYNDAFATILNETATNPAMFHALLFPQAGTDAVNAKVTIDNINYNVPLTINNGEGANTWKKGYMYTYNLTINGTSSGTGTELVVSSVTVNQWQDGGSANPEI